MDTWATSNIEVLGVSGQARAAHMHVVSSLVWLSGSKYGSGQSAPDEVNPTRVEGNSMDLIRGT